MAKTPSPTKLARIERMRVAAEAGAEARADVHAHDIAIRKNMARLRALRLAKEAEEAALPKPAPAAKPRRTKSKTTS